MVVRRGSGARGGWRVTSAGSWPAVNPFPFQASTETPNNAVDLDDPPSGGVTWKFAHVTRAEDLVGDYLRNYGKSKVGRATMLNGEHGSGKSHTIRYLIDRIAHGNWQRDEAPPAVKLAAKIVGADFLAVYQLLMSQINQDLLRSVAFDSLNTLAGEQWVSGASKDARQMIKDRLESDKGAAMKAFAQYLVDRDAVEAKQASDLTRAGVDRHPEFQRAFPFILSDDKELSGLAWSWISGQSLSDEALQKLGVKPISSVAACVTALTLIMQLFKRAGRPLIVFLDQFEKLTAGEQYLANIEVLRQLIDAFPENEALLMVAGTDAAWERFSPDMQA